MNGHNKTQFEEWYHNALKGLHVYETCMWDELPLSMQWGVCLEYYDSIGIDLDMECNKSNHDWILTECEFDRQDVQNEALLKANEIANKVLRHQNTKV